MTITGGSALPKDEVERMMREAEEYAEEDHKRREEAETRNSADQLVFQTEKFLGENGAKLPAEGKADVESALTDLKAALGGSDVAAVKSAAATLSEKSQALGGALYSQQSAENAATGGPAEDDGIVDAEVVDGTVEDEGK